jgi:hypothetical protein
MRNMETTKIQQYLNSEEKELRFTDWAVRAITIILILLLNQYRISGQSLYSQVTCPQTGIIRGINLDTYSSGNGHGAFFCPSVTFNKGRNSVSVGPTIQKRSMDLNGFKLSYSRNLSAESDDLGNIYLDRIQLNFFSYLQYTDKLPLSYSVIKNENLIAREPQPNWENVKLATTEFAAGIELRVNFSSNISWKTYVGVSAYYHLNYLIGMDHERMAPSLSLGTGINILLPRL